ncbi:hypothetical protein [Arthrobacter sp. lap29]|uniref:hypothetical protein n=1 Tax=Arthrobacter sp. lap29 TaxID=3056122 RepID=UPI0028F73862|nr:hypothetical protein [Arthrobacter sp. lap29]
MSDKFDGYGYFRRVKEHESRFFFFTKAKAEWEVMIEPGKIERVVGMKELWTKLDASGRDFQECEMTASRMFRTGRFDQWVQWPYGGTITTEELPSGD